MNKNYLCIIFDVHYEARTHFTNSKKNQQKIPTEQIKTATQLKLITFKTRETQNNVLKMKNR
jgi:hypothetical protein